MKTSILAGLLFFAAKGAAGFGLAAEGTGYLFLEHSWLYSADQYDRTGDGVPDLIIQDDATQTISEIELNGTTSWSYVPDFSAICPGCGEGDERRAYFKGFFVIEPGHRDAVFELYVYDNTNYVHYERVVVVSAYDNAVRYEFDAEFDAAVDLDNDGYAEMILWVDDGCWQVWSRNVPNSVPAAVEPGLKVGRNRPNPFNPATVVAFSLDHSAATRVDIHDLGGRLVYQRDLGTLPAGDHEFPWSGIDRNGRSVAAGAYTCTVIAGDRHRTRKMMLVK